MRLKAAVGKINITDSPSVCWGQPQLSRALNPYAFWGCSPPWFMSGSGDLEWLLGQFILGII